MADYLRLDGDLILATVDRLRQRVEQRFPDSGLSRVAQQLCRVASQARERSISLPKPIPALRAAVFALVALILAGLVATFLSLRAPAEPLTLLDFLDVLESGINDVVFVGAGIFFLVTIETRIKRHRALPAINELRAIAHIIDMQSRTSRTAWCWQPSTRWRT
jgi:xanthosine utilization system XapX-like protein